MAASKNPALPSPRAAALAPYIAAGLTPAEAYRLVWSATVLDAAEAAEKAA